MSRKCQKEMVNLRNQLTVFTETDLKVFQSPREVIEQAEKVIGWKFYTFMQMYERLQEFYKERQMEIFNSEEKVDMVLAMSFQNNEAFKREMNSLDNDVKNTARDSITMETDLGVIFLDAVLRRSRIQWYRPIALSGANFLYIAENYQDLYKLVIKSSPKNNSISREKDYNEVVSKVVEKLPEKFRKVYNVVLILETRRYVKENEEEIKQILEKYSTGMNKKAIEMYLGIECKPYSYEEIGNRLGFTEEQVYKYFVEGIKKMNYLLRRECLNF